MALRGWLVVALSLAITACGFHLRGSEPLPEVMARTWIAAPNSSPLRYELEGLLLTAGGSIAPDIETSTVSLKIHSAKMKRRTASVDEQGRDSEYAMRLIVAYSLHRADGMVLVEQTSQRVERYVGFDPDNVLARDGERERVEREMYRVVAQQIIRHLRRVAPSAQEGGAGK